MRIFVLVGTAVWLIAGGAALADTRALTLGPFTGVDAAAGVTVVVESGRPQAVALEGRSEDFDRIEVRVRGATLSVRQAENQSWFREAKKVVVRVAAPTIERLEASCAAEVTAANLRGGPIALEASSGADLIASGTCERLSVEVSSGADIDARGLVCTVVTADASSGGDARLKAAPEVRARASSGGDILIQGQPGRLDRSESSGGDIRIQP